MAAIRQLLSQTSYDGDGTTLVWNFTFADGYLDQAHVKASILIKATGLETQVPLTAANFVGPYQVRITPAVPVGSELTIYRDTPKDRPLVNFVDRASLTEASLDFNARQCVMVAAEASDGLTTAIQSVAVVANLAQSAERFTGLAQGYAAEAATNANWAADSARLADASTGYANTSALAADRARSLAEQAKADTMTALAQVAAGPVVSVAGRQGVISRAQVRADLGIDKVDNTSDFDKGVNRATIAELATKVTHNNSAVNITWVQGDGVRIQVDNTNFGSRWPISISGVAASAGYATTAGAASTANYATSAASANYAASAGSAGSASTANYASNAGLLNGKSPSAYLLNATSQNEISWGWDGNSLVGRVDGSVQYPLTEWSRVANRVTNVSQLANDSRYAQYIGQYGVLVVAAPDGAGVAGGAIPNPDGRMRYLQVINGGIGTIIDGQSYSWAINPSDENLKENIRITEEDSLTKVMHMEFKSFTFNDVSPMMAGIKRKSGLIAQHLEAIDPDFITKPGDYRQLNIETLLTASLHALKQLATEVYALKAQMK